jgi:hypothetical protein
MTKALNGKIRSIVNKGFTFISLDYRLLATKYWFRSCDGQEHEEEYIAVSHNGEMTIPSEEDPMSSYKVKVGRQEFITKCIYDAARAMDYIVEYAADLKVDLGKVGFMADSAGGALANYLIWTYPRLKPGLYHPISATFNGEQLDYPVQNTLDRVWSLFVDEVGEDALLSDYLQIDDCPTIVGNPWCVQRSVETDLCNDAWHRDAVERFCGATRFPQVTFGELQQSQVWTETTEQDRGLAYLWYPSQQMQLYQPANVKLWIFNKAGGATGDKSWAAIAHHSIFAKKYLDLCTELKIDCIGYYSAWLHIKETSRGTDLEGLQYKETFGWRASSEGSANTPGSYSERLAVHAFAAGI